MGNTIKFPEGYRYDSDIEVFKKAVDCAKTMLDNKQIIIVYQFIDVISARVNISQDEFEREYAEIGWDDFNNILDNEIVYLLRQNFEQPNEDDDELKRYLMDREIPEEWQKEIIELKLEKCRYVSQYLGGEKEKNRYNLKKRSFFKKLSDIDFELSRTLDEEEITYATIKMSVNSILEGKDVLKAVGNILNQGKDNITFICDKSDIEYLIQNLERIKQML